MSPLHYLGRRLAAFLAKPRERYSHIPTSPTNLLAATLRKGDVVLVEGSSRFATAIKYLTQSTWSHAALCIGDALGPPPEGEEPRVLVDVDVVEGVRTIPLSTFSGLHTRICRPVGLEAAEIDALVEFMLSRKGITYDLKNIFDLARYFIRTPPVPGSMKRRMLSLGSGEPTKAICSTLLAQAFASIRYPILPEVELVDADAAGARRARREILHIRHHSLYAPRDFDVSPFFQIVKPRIAHGFDFRSLDLRPPGPGGEAA
ncbi:MAG TPA: YiiX/YebB-like N1pC/P60 family cysteine hydrolase [Arenimonas sp.]|uniref:YiiX/YebB-like N1pC/P60 family cysteine hydrolase n=1 Tax=Arenimonas sp. TaxID=1872635 RepID=UPI002D7FA02F|nr:YiiX/YebB-like N1pC/P60 family cysteine hydrolase [Arenimonas sp.]HEU0152250.1 YiiX/YebB-like N1pC/P60 family cysteine hydrolase [Arenimonas sp.]